VSNFAKAALRTAAKRVVRNAPFGLGRTLRDYDVARERLRELELRLAELAQRDEVLYWRLVAASMGQPPEQLWPEGAPVERPLSYRALLRQLRRQARFLERLQAGEPLEEVIVEFVRERLHVDDEQAARSLSYGLLANPTTRVVGRLALAIVADRRHLPRLAWEQFREIPPETWRRFAAREYFHSGFRVDRPAAVAAAERIVEERPPELPPYGWLDIVKAAFGANEIALAGRILEAADGLAGLAPEQWVDTAPGRDWLRDWLGRSLRPAAVPEVASDSVCLAVLDYKQPDHLHTSTNIGDYVQTLACLGHVARHQNLRFRGAPDLVDLVTELQKRVRPELALDSSARDVTLMAANRDATSIDRIPAGTWVVAFGWYMHATFERYDFPLNPNLRPIFVSFHCNRPEMLTAEGLAYLRRYAPIGCRDWSTVDLLLSAGVPAFLTGCLTTTLNAVFPDLEAAERPAGDAPIAYVDVAGPAGTETIRQERGDVRRTGLVANIRDAMEMMEHYRRRYSSIVTSRLHCYLPARAIGASVEFKPHNPADIRYNGLIGLSDTEYADMRRQLLTMLEQVFAAIFAGRSEQEVYALWREVCAEEVARAAARRTTLPPPPAPSFDIAEACARVRAKRVVVERSAPAPAGPEVHVVMALDGNLRDRLPVVVEAMATGTARPLHLWILARGHGPADHRRLARLFPQVSFCWLPCDALDYGQIAGTLKPITASTMDRLLLPELLPELDRIVLHDIDALALGDIGELYDWDLSGQPLAARSSIAGNAVSGLTNLLRSLKRLREDPPAAYECLRRVCARHQFDFTAFNAGILVFDLARMRADGFCQEFIPFVERYGMDDQEVLNCYAGGDRAWLPPEWNADPAQEVVTDPKVLHWAGPFKPWDQEHAPWREAWTGYERRLRDRERRLDPARAASPEPE
jgi:lipopolysaccharide biosynthesis glycosyltransferase